MCFKDLMLEIYQCWTSVFIASLPLLSWRDVKWGTLERDNFKITGNQLPSVPDDEIEGISRKKKTLKKPEVFGYLGKVYMKTESCYIVIKRMPLDTVMSPDSGLKKLCGSSLLLPCWPQRANRSPLKWLQRLHCVVAPSFRVAWKLFCLYWLASFSCKPSSQPCCMPDSSPCCLVNLPSDPVFSTQTN